VVPAPIAEEIGWPSNVSSWMRRLATQPWPLFFDSARFDAALGRYSYLAVDPFLVLRSRGRRVERWRPGEPVAACDNDPLAVLARELRPFATQFRPELPPFQGGAAGLLGYDLCRHLERLPRARGDEFALPEMVVGLYDTVVALDHLERRAWVVATGFPASGARRLRRARSRLERLKQRLADSPAPSRADRPSSAGSTTGSGPMPWDTVSASHPPMPLGALVPQFSLPDVPSTITSNFDRDGYLRAVRRAIEYIHAGDVYQVNLAQRLVCPLREPPLELYLRLRERNPAPFAAYFDAGDLVVASSSPERFLRVSGREVETRPIKGTRPRWSMPVADMYSAAELRDSAKDRAENVMIVDLLRNDLGRVCEFGSVQVTRPLQIESYQYVHHLVSEVRGRLRAHCGPIELLRAAFPGGSVTGAPKIRAMEIIAELEPTVRGPYCGAIAFLGFDGSMDSSILIRTFTCARGWVQFPVGGGIVADSCPEQEYAETLHKAEGLIQALGLIRGTPDRLSGTATRV
jgi:para-aminobenzoate synthetase component 1